MGKNKLKTSDIMDMMSQGLTLGRFIEVSIALHQLNNTRESKIDSIVGYEEVVKKHFSKFSGDSNKENIEKIRTEVKSYLNEKS